MFSEGFRPKPAFSRAAAAHPARKCRVFTRQLAPRSAMAKRTGFRGCLAARKYRFFTAAERNGHKNHVFLRTNSHPPFGPLSGGGCGSGMRNAPRKPPFLTQKFSFATAPSPPPDENPLFSRPPPPSADPSRAGRGPIRPACARDSAPPAQIHRVLPRELARREPGPGTGPFARRNAGVAPGTGQKPCVFAGAAPPEKRVEPAP